jgi:hypothetical protein
MCIPSSGRPRATDLEQIMNRIHRNAIALLAVVLTACSLVGCSTWEKLDRTEQGAVIGTGGGAVVGGAVGGTKGAVVGGVLGGVTGGVIGHNTD